MKMMSVVMLAVMGFSGAASAAEVSTCVEKVYDKCGSLARSLERKLDVRRADDCKIVTAKGISMAAFLGGDESLTSVDLNACNVSRYSFQSGDIVENKVFEGRLFVVLASGRVAMLGRNNSIYEMNNAKGEPYVSVTGIKVNQAASSITLERSNGSTELTLEQIDNRILDGKITTLAIPSR